MMDFDRKFKKFLESLRDSNNDSLINAVLEGYDITCGHKNSPNPYALVDVIEKPEPYYDISPFTIHQVSDIEKGHEEELSEICERLGITIENIKDHYLTSHQNLPVYKYLETLRSAKSWKNHSYYDNEKDEYYGLFPKKYAIPINNKYRNNDVSGHY